MPDLTWKEGPPPLDVPGVYVVKMPDCVLGVWKVSKHVPPPDGVVAHFGPIPSPPTGDET